MKQILQRWIDTLAAMVLGFGETWRSRRAFFVTRERDGLIVRQGGARGGEVVARIATGTLASAELVRDARRHFITLELPADEIAVQRINVPARAVEFLSGIVGNQIERLSPWPGDQVAYGFAVEPNHNDPGILDVRVLMAARALVNAVREELAAAGLALDRIVARAAEPDPGQPVAIWSRLDAASEQTRERARRPIALGMLAVLALSIGIAAWAQMSAASLRADSDEAGTRLAALQGRLEPGRAAGVTLDPSRRAWTLKETSPSAVIILETLSRAIPDTAYLTELSLQKTTVRITGMTGDAPSLLAPLEQSGQLADVRFFAPTTRGPDGSSYEFHIEGRVTPRLDLTEN